jgi:hypothetical protein
MARADAAKLLAENLASLPAVDGNGPPVRLLQYSTAGKSPEQTTDTSRRALDVGARLIHILESAGYTISHRSDPKPEIREGQYTVVEAHCAHCGQKVLELSHIQRDPNRADRMKATLHRVALESMGHPHGCWR